MVGADTAILPLQNGVEASSHLERIYSGHVLGGICRIVARRSGPHRIVHEDVEPFIALGELDKRRSGRVLELVKVLKKAEALDVTKKVK